MSVVALVRCETYEYDAVKDAVERGLALIGGPGRFAGPGEKILLKPNLLVDEPPEKCVNTHPAVFRAVAEAFKQTGASIYYGDSPGMFIFEFNAKKCGIDAAAAETGVTLADFKNGEEVFFEDGIQNKKFRIASGVLACHGLISLPKFKAHGLTRITGAVKNQFGCIPGQLKAEFHVRLPDLDNFSRMLVDLNRFIRPRLFILDGITAMEGNGPRGGTPRQMNVLMFSTDPVALDATVCRMIGLDPEYVPTNIHGKQGGLGTYLENEIEIKGDNLDSFKVPSFKVRRETEMRFIRLATRSPFIGALRNLFIPKPYIDNAKCVKCGACAKACPVSPKAVDWHDGRRDSPPSYRYRRCIRCYCCQELCPESAIQLRVPFLRRLLAK